jgi:hypothetical protein
MILSLIRPPKTSPRIAPIKIPINCRPISWALRWNFSAYAEGIAIDRAGLAILKTTAYATDGRSIQTCLSIR